MRLRFSALTHPGIVRQHNEDAYYVDPAGRFFMVADGMGGYSGGERASQLAVSLVALYLDTHWQSTASLAETIQQAILRANEHLLVEQAENPVIRDMGTTLVLLCCGAGNQAWYCHVGDSRLYRFRHNHLEQLTRDHTWVAQAVEAGGLSPLQARSHPWRHLLTQCLGREDLEPVVVQSLTLEPGDCYLLCSDGLTEEVLDWQIAATLRRRRSPEWTVQALVDAACQHGGRDNITAVVVQVLEETEAPPA
ncbi:MAG: protein phosphatase 2C domain-containing protein [Gloeomargarita sp. SKYBB_i_bin120]|nr:protein phosphatase 2C domain-containing protein [Gloeomargarita sp. SKYG98]MCS7292874.1 protein phosphatase 2C domain-containing protein [Gloeomargarita sp. SKYB120]MDW8178437.1 protein phosphatase 2C domain-containing protein [Gloeomargarita sp. SKYBB_i_bin120]